MIFPALLIGGMGLLFGAALGAAGKLFYVSEDPRVAEVRECLPGANCGGCGLSGCDAFAAAVVSGKAPVTGCPVGSSPVADKIADVLGRKHEKLIRMSAFVKCGGFAAKTVWNYDYVGLSDCRAVNALAGGGPKACAYGCLGEGSCVGACNFGAITINDGLAVVDPDKCTACGMCVKTCPRGLIELAPYDKTTRVVCNSLANGKTVRSACKVGCIGCKQCERACQYGAVAIDGFLARINYEKCVMCGDCAAKCPTGAIVGALVRSKTAEA
jgi:Na+-translocating ferredoxin:NAD+ oxidoreductase RNF subunit RnfB